MARLAHWGTAIVMNYLAENSLPIWAAGAVAFTMALVAYLQTRSSTALLAIVTVIGLVAVLLVSERLIETPREAVERTLYELAETVEANDVAGALGFVAPSANSQIRKDIERLMPLVNIERARVMGTPKIEFEANRAFVKCRGIIIATNKQNGMKGGAEDELTMTWVQVGNRWLVKDYTSQRNWNRALGR
jgi:hypothetical protein